MIERSDKLLLLDLDETLIHATTVPLARLPDFHVDTFHVYKRPGLDQFLNDIAQHYTIGVWSTGSDLYVKEVVEAITPTALLWQLVWGKSRCTTKIDAMTGSYYFEKKLDKVKKQGFRLEQVIIVDDSPEKSRSNYGNAVYIKPFMGEANDRELSCLYDYLLTLKGMPNIRNVEKRGWRTRFS